MGTACSSLTAPPTSTCAKCRNKVKALDEKVCMCCRKPYHNACIYVIAEIPSEMRNSVAGFYKSKIYKIKGVSDSPKDMFCCSVCYHKKYMESYFSWFEKYEYYVSSKEKKKSRRSSGSNSIKERDSALAIPIPVIEEHPSIAQKRALSRSFSHPHPYTDQHESPSEEIDIKMKVEITPPEDYPPIPPASQIHPHSLPPLPAYPFPPADSENTSNQPLIKQQRDQLTKLVSVLYGQDLVMQELQASQNSK